MFDAVADNRVRNRLRLFRLQRRLHHCRTAHAVVCWSPISGGNIGQRNDVTFDPEA